MVLNDIIFSAAAYCRQEQYDLAIQDCRTALALEPNYAKAYGRMGLLYLHFIEKVVFKIIVLHCHAKIVMIKL